MRDTTATTDLQAMTEALPIHHSDGTKEPTVRCIGMPPESVGKVSGGVDRSPLLSVVETPKRGSQVFTDPLHSHPTSLHMERNRCHGPCLLG